MNREFYDLGNVSVQEISIGLDNNHDDKLDISGLCLNLSIYESIFSKHTTGFVTVVDARNLINNLLLSGQETIKISYKLPYLDDVIERIFRIYKISNVKNEGDLVQGYNIHFCESLMFRTKEERLSKTLRGSHSNMLSKIFEDLEQEIKDIEPTVGDNHQFIIPNWSINKTLDWLVNNSNPQKELSYKNSMFLYQTIDGEYHFKSMDSMLEDSNEIVFSHVPITSKSDVEINEDSRNQLILDVLRPQEFDTLRGLSTGAYASILKVYDPIRKIQELNVYDIKESIKRRQSESDNTNDSVGRVHPLYLTDDKLKNYTDINPNSTVINSYTTTHSFDNSKKLSNDETFQGVKNTDNSILERHALIELLNQNRIEVIVPTRTDIQVGKKITFDLPAGEVMIGENKVVDTTYLVTTISTHINCVEKNGMTTIECSKESKLLSDRDLSYQEKVSELLRDMEGES